MSVIVPMSEGQLKRKRKKNEGIAMESYSNSMISQASDVGASRESKTHADLFKRLASGKGIGNAGVMLEDMADILRYRVSGIDIPELNDLSSSVLMIGGSDDITTPKFISSILRVYPDLFDDYDLLVQIMEEARLAVSIAFGAASDHQINSPNLLKVIENSLDTRFNMRLIESKIREDDSLSEKEQSDYIINIERQLQGKDAKQTVSYLAHCLIKLGAATKVVTNNGEPTLVVTSGAETRDMRKLAMIILYIFVNDIKLLGHPTQEGKGDDFMYSLHPSITKELAVSMLKSKDGRKFDSIFLKAPPKVDVSATGGMSIWSSRQGDGIQVAPDGMFGGNTDILEECLNRMNSAPVVIHTAPMVGLARLQKRKDDKKIAEYKKQQAEKRELKKLDEARLAAIWLALIMKHGM